MEQQKSCPSLVKAAHCGDYEAVKNLLQRGSNVNEVDNQGNSSLHYAVLQSSFKMTKLLLLYNARVNIRNNNGFRAYDFALTFPNYKIMNILLKYKAKVHINDIFRMTESLDYPENLKKLLYEKVNVERVDSLGFTALHHAVESNDLNGIRTLISRGADVNKFTKKGRLTSLYLAKSTECIKILLREGAQPNLRAKSSCSPLCALATEKPIFDLVSIKRKEKRRMIEELIRNGADCIEAIYYAKNISCYETSSESRYGLKEILKFMALKEHEHYYMNVKYLGLNRGNVLGSFYRRCLNEVALLKEEKLSDYLTYYDFAAKNIYELSKYVDNKSIKKAFKNKSKLMIMFPIYNKILWGHFEEAAKERKLREAACSSLSCAIPCINAGHTAMHKILNFIEIEDMKNLVEAFP